MVNTLERGNGKNGPSFAATAINRKHGDQKIRIESNRTRGDVKTSSDAKELNSSDQNLSQTHKISVRTFKEKEESVSEEIERIEELPQTHSNSQTANSKTVNAMGTSGTSFIAKSITRGMNSKTKQIQKLIPVKSTMLNTNSVNFLKLFPPNGRSNSVFGPQMEFPEMDARESLRTIGWLFIIGGSLLGLLAMMYEPMPIWVLMIWFLVSLLIGLFYFWAADLSETLDDHCAAYRIGFWLTVLGWPLVFTLIISVPLWIIGAIYDSGN